MNIKSNEIKLVNINDIQPNNKNRNYHSEEQIDRLVEIIKYQGFRSPLIISNRSGLLVSGHGRLLAARKLGLAKLPVIYQDFDSEEQEYAAGISENAIASWAELDLAGINFDLQDLGPDFDLDLLGIKDFHLDVAEKLEPGCDEDDAPELPKESKVKRGDIFILGNHRLMCGDSTMIDDVEKLMDGENADMVFTDPPYGVSYQSNWRTNGVKFDRIKNDETFLYEWVNVLPVVSIGWVFVWTTWKVLQRWIDITAPIGTITNMIIWDKGGGGIGDLNKTFSTDYEMALVFNRDANITGKRLGSVWSIGKDRHKEYIHPTQKPVELAETALESCTEIYSKVLDLFGGSGSTLIACEKINRKCYMMELDEHYCSVILDRWQKYSNKKATHVNGTSWDDIKNSV